MSTRLINKLLTLKEKLNISHNELAKRLEIGRMTLHNYLKGNYDPRLNMIKKIVQLCREQKIAFKVEDLFDSPLDESKIHEDPSGV